MDSTEAQELKEESQKRLEQLKAERCIAKLLRDGIGVDEIVASYKFSRHAVQRVQNRIADGEDLECLTPKEIGWRRSAGLISDSEMLRVLKGWPYTFSEVKDDAVVQSGDWDDIEVLYAEGYLTSEEYRELLDETRKSEDTSNNEDISVSAEQVLKEFSVGVERCIGQVLKTSISSDDNKAMAGVLSGDIGVFSPLDNSFQVSSRGSISLHGLDDQYFGLRFGEMFRDDVCIHGNLETSVVMSVDNGVCTSATLATNDDDGNVLLEQSLGSTLTSSEVIELIQKSRVVMELKNVFKGSRVIDGALQIPFGGDDTMVVSFSDYLWNDAGEAEEGKDSILLTCTTIDGEECSYADYIASMFPECRIVCQESWNKVRVSVPVLSFW